MDSSITSANETATVNLENFVPGWAWLSWLGPLLPMLNNPYIQESIRFLLLGSVLETGRRVWQWLMDRITSGFFVTAHFSQGDWAYDWLNDFLAAQEIWTNSREYRVTASNLEKEWTCLPGGSTSADKATSPVRGSGDSDGNPSPLYFPSSEMPQVMRWNGHWVQIVRKPGTISFGQQMEENASLSVTVYTRNNKILDQLVNEARKFYLKSNKPPSAAQSKKSALTLKAMFSQGDWTYDWLLEFLNEQGAWQNSNEVIVTAKTAEKKWGMDLGGHERDEKLRAYYQPSSASPHLWCWNGTWIQILRTQGSKDYRTGREEGASITLTLFTGRKKVLDELVAAAAAQYWETSKARVTVHIAETYGDWGAIMTKQIRPMDSVILPSGVTNLLIRDLKEFLDSKDWYAAAGIPWRRGVLLWGEPGTGKSTTVHAIAGELQLEIYFLSLASNGLDDSSLQRLVSATPPNCIILIEDIDCAFPSRETDEEQANEPFNPYSFNQPRSSVTLSGLLNLLDSVSSEEGRIVFATTNHLDRLDPALLRPGRMDLRIEYKLATTNQIADLFKRFYSQEIMSKYGRAAKDDQATSSLDEKQLMISEEAAALIKMTDNSSIRDPLPSTHTIASLAEDFAAKVPAGKFSIAQLQGYLLSRKRNPAGAVREVDVWIEEREKESQEKLKRQEERVEARKKWERTERRRLAREKRMEEEDERRDEEEEERERKEAEEAKLKDKEAEGGSTEREETGNEEGSRPSSVASDPVMVEDA